MFSKKITGSSSRMAAISSPLASYGVEGTATLSPGTWVKIEYRLWECWLAARMPAPHMVRITIGTLALPPNM